MLGRSVMAELEEHHLGQVVGIGYSRIKPGMVQIDLTQAEQVVAALDSLRPTVIIHAAAERRPDVSENDPTRTRLLNVDATATLAGWAHKNKAWLILISTDYVFDGKCPPYSVVAKPAPLNGYGASKLAAEIVVQSMAPSAAILRVPVLYGPVEHLDESAVTVIAQAMLTAKAHGTSVEMDHWAIRYPTFTSDIAVVLRQMLQRHARGQAVSGIYHWSGLESMTKYDMALTCAPLVGLDPARITAHIGPAQGTPRPKDCHLDCSRLTTMGIGQQTLFRAGIKRVLAPFLELT